MMDMSMLASPLGSLVELDVSGPDAEACADALEGLIAIRIRRRAGVSRMKVFRGNQRVGWHRGRRGSRAPPRRDPDRRGDDPAVAARKGDRQAQRALAATRKDIEKLEDETRGRIGDLSRLLTVYQTFLDDATIVTPIMNAIRQKNLSAQSALHNVVRGFAERFLKMGEPFSNYAPELLDLERRVQARLLGKELMTLDRLPRPVVVIADELAPMQALAIDREKVLAFATESGSTESHTAILARHSGSPR